MRCIRTMKFTLAWTGLLSVLLLALLVTPLIAQPARAPQSGRGFGPVYDAAHEITLNGTVQEVVSKHALGSPAGMHLLVAGPEGTVDAHVGSFLSKDTREALHLGLPIQIVEAMETLHGKQYLLARQLIFGGRMVTVRNRNGFLVDERFGSRNRRNAKSEMNGGAR